MMHLAIKYFNKEEINHARNTDILEYLLSKGENFLKQGNYYRHAEHSSWVYDNRKKVMYFNKEVTNYATNSCITVALKVYQFNFNEAVTDILSSGAEILLEERFEKDKLAKPMFDYKREVKEDTNTNAAFDYLVNKRQLDAQLVEQLINAGLIRQDNHQNIVFKYLNRETNQLHDVVGVELRGSRLIPEEKRIHPNRPYFLMQHELNQPDTGFYIQLSPRFQTAELKVFEAPIEVLSYLTIKKDCLFHQEQRQNIDFLSMGGLKQSVVFEHYKKIMLQNRLLATQKKEAVTIPTITLCVNNDEGGQKFIERFTRFLQEQAFSESFIQQKLKVELPVSQVNETLAIDYNDLLQERKGLSTITVREEGLQ